MRLLLVVIVVLASACTAAPLDTTPPAASSSDDTARASGISAERLAPLTGLGPCRDVESPDLPTPDDVPLPTTFRAGVVEDVGELTSIQGYVERTPVEVLAELLVAPGWTVAQSDDEGFEAEILLVDGDRRFYVKTQAVCERGSSLVSFLGENIPVPTPTGGTTP